MKIQVSYISDNPSCDNLQVWDQNQLLGFIAENDFLSILSTKQISQFENSQNKFDLNYEKLFENLDIFIPLIDYNSELLSQLDLKFTNDNFIALRPTKKIILMTDPTYHNSQKWINYYVEVSGWNYPICEAFAKKAGYGIDIMNQDGFGISFFSKLENGKIYKLAIISKN